VFTINNFRVHDPSENALARRKETYEQTGKSISWSALSVELTGLKNKPGFEWLKEIDSQLSQQAVADCKRAFDNFFKKLAGFPRFVRHSKLSDMSGERRTRSPS